MTSGRWGRRDRRHRDSADDAIERRLNAERTAAVAIVRTIRELLDAGKAISPPAPEWVTAGVAEELSHAFNEVPEGSRLQAQALAECQLAVASRLDDSYPADVRASSLAIAWTNVATADLLSAAPRAALKSLDEADAALDGHPEPELLRAVVDVSRAPVLNTLGRDEEARKLVERAREVFERWGHEDGLVQCAEILAMIGRPGRRRR
jgi:hypothetical protein